MRTLNRLFCIFFSFATFTSFAMESFFGDFAATLNDMQRQIGGMTQSFRTNPYGASSSNANNQSKDAYSHCKSIAVPPLLKGLVHMQCDCQDLVQSGHYCGSHALTHAVDIEQTYGVRDNKV